MIGFKYLKYIFISIKNIYLIFNVEPETCNNNVLTFKNKCLIINKNFKFYKNV